MAVPDPRYVFVYLITITMCKGSFLKCVCLHTDLFRQVLQEVLSQAQVSQVGQVTDPSRQRGQLVIGQHQFLGIKI